MPMRSMTRLPVHLALAALVAALAPACWSDDRPVQWSRPRDILGPVALKAHVAYIDSALDRVVLVDVTGDAPVVSHTAIGRSSLQQPAAATAQTMPREPAVDSARHRLVCMVSDPRSGC